MHCRVTDFLQVLAVLQGNTAVMFLCLYYCVFKCVRECQTTLEKKANFQSNENANCLFCVILLCPSESEHSTGFEPSQNDPQSALTWLGQITGAKHLPHSLLINQSPLLLCSLLMYILNSSIDFCHSELFCLYPAFELSPYIQSRGRFCNRYYKSWCNEKWYKWTDSWMWLGWLTISN